MSDVTGTYFTDEDLARRYFEEKRWPLGVVCPHCGADGAMELPTHKRQCRACRGQFSVTVGTMFQDSNIPLRKWLLAIHSICASGRGITAVQLQREAGFGSYRTAWLLRRRIRWAMRQNPMAALIRLTGDEPGGSARRPLRIRLSLDQTVAALLAVKPEARDSAKGDRTSGAKMERRPVRLRGKRSPSG